MSNETTFRAAILGYGRNGSTMHAGGLENSSAFEVVAVCDIALERQKQAAERHGCAIYGDDHEMLAAEELDLVVIVTRTDQHCQMAIDCLNAGVNVLVTKPWSVNRDEAQRMVAAAEQAGKQLMCWLPARWGCNYRRIGELLSENAIGEVFLIRHTVQNFATRDDWQTERKYGDGYLLNWGAHVLDPPVQLAGGLGEVASVFGRLLQRVNPGDAEDNLLATITMSSGTVVMGEFSIAVEHLPKWYIQGTGGTILVRGSELTLAQQQLPRPSDPTRYAAMASTDPEVTTETLEGATWGDTDEIYIEVADALAGRKAYPVSMDDAVALPGLFDAVRESAESDTVVHLT
jgi:predicted dehydrogenase